MQRIQEYLQKTARDNYIFAEDKLNYFLLRETLKIVSLKIPIIQRFEEGNH